MEKIILRFREKHKISQEKLAKLLNLSQQSISNYESGINKPKIEKFFKLVKIFNKYGFEVNTYNLIKKFYS